MNYSALIYAYDQENIAVTGEGILDGQASGRTGGDERGATLPATRKRGGNGSSISANAASRSPDGSSVRPNLLRPNFFQPYKCRNVSCEE